MRTTKSFTVEICKLWALSAFLVIGVCQGSCPSGWDEMGTNCYKRHINKTTFYNARSYCRRETASLVPVTDEDAMEMINAYYYNGVNTYWTGGYNYSTYAYPERWVWTNQGYGMINSIGRDTNFNMAPDQHLNITVDGGLCVTTSNGKDLNAVNCSRSYDFICSFRKSKYICPPGYDSYDSGSRCYSTGQYKHTQEEARAICPKRYGVLYEPRTLLDVQNINSMLRRQNWDMYDQHLGIVYKDHAWRFESDNVEIPSDMWSDNYPIMQEGKTCGMYSTTTKKLVNVACSERHHYLCLYKSKPHCPPGYQSFYWGSDCYMIPPFSLKFDSSVSFCRQWGGEIATLRDSYNNYLADKLQYYRKSSYGDIKIWIDVNDRTVDGKYQYSDGTSKRGELGLTDTSYGNCFYLYNRALKGSDCGYARQSLCMAKSGDCPNGFLKKGTDCFRFSTKTRERSFAESFCEYHSSFLSWTHNKNILTNELGAGYNARTSSKPSFWYGATLDSASMKWIFKDDTNKKYSSNSSELSSLWSPGYPVDGDDCMLMMPNGSVRTRGCSSASYYFICQATEEHQGMDLPHHNLLFTTPTCFREDLHNPQFKISPGMYDPGHISMTRCQGRCRNIGFNYAGVKHGKYCFCSNILTLVKVNSEYCNNSCSDSDSGEICGAPNNQYISVITVGSTGDETETFISGVSLAATPAVVDVGSTITYATSISTGKGSFYRLRFGEGGGYTLGNELAFTTGTSPVAIEVEVTYTYHHPGTYKATVMYYDEEGIQPPVYESVEINVTRSAPSPVKLDCPVVVELQEMFYCQATMFYGSPLSISVTNGDGSPIETYAFKEPPVQSMGIPVPQGPMEGMLNTIINSSGSTPAAIIMPWTSIEQDSVLLSFSAYVSIPGDVTFMVLRPSCNGASVCAASGRCESNCASFNSTVYSCPTGLIFCFHGLSCYDDGSPGPCRSSLGALPINYEVIVEETMSTVAGFNRLTLDQALHMWPQLQRGDVLGFIPGSAVVGYHHSSSGSDIGFSQEGSYSVVASQDLGVRHYVSATVSRPVTVDIPHNYTDIGNYTFSVSVNNDFATVTNSSLIAAQIPIHLDPPVFDPPNVAIYNHTTVTIPIINGSDILVMFDWGDGNVTWRYFRDLEDTDIVEDHQYNKAGAYDTVVKVFNLHTTVDQYPEERWIFYHTLFCQEPCNESVWSFTNNGPVLWPTPGNMDFTISALPNETLPSNASFSINYGDGSASENVDYLVGSNATCNGLRTFGTPVCMNGFTHTENNNYVTGQYDVSFSCKNLVSNFTSYSEAIVYASIEGLSTTAKFIPLLPIGGTIRYNGFGANKDQFPVEREVDFLMQVTQGTVVSYYAEFENGTRIGNSSTDILSLKFTEPGRYNINIYAENPLQTTSPLRMTIEAAESVSQVEIDDFHHVTDANTNKTFRIQWESKGSFACYILDYGDGTILDVWRTLDDLYAECDQWLNQNKAKFPKGIIYNKRGLLPSTQPLHYETEHLYVNKGHYMMRLFAFNKMANSSHTLNITVAPVPCSPPLLYLKDNATKFFEPKTIQRSFIIRIESVCKLNCTNSLNTTKFWTGVSIDEQWGYPLQKVNMVGWDSQYKSILSIPPRTLDYGTYMFTYEVVIIDEWLRIHEPDIPPFRRSKSTYLKVVKSPLVLMMNRGGVARIVLGFNKTLLISPEEYSYDPDWLDAKDFEFSWYCHRIEPSAEILAREKGGTGWPTDGIVSSPLRSVEDVYTYIVDPETNITETIEEPDNGGCFGKGPGKINIDGGTLNLNTMQLRKTNMTYRFTVTMKRDTRMSEGFLDVQLVAGSPPAIDVRCQIEKMCRQFDKGIYINPNLRLALMARCTDDCYGTLKYTWTIYSYSNNTQTLITNGDAFMVGPDKPDMVIQKTLFEAYPDVLIFHVKITLERVVDKEKGEGFMYLELNTPPRGGTCTLKPPPGKLLQEDSFDSGKELGRALTEDYRSDCVGFIDDQKDKISKYTFLLKHTEFGYIKNVKFGVDSGDKFAFPYGNWSFLVQIEDEYGASTTVEIAEFSTSLPTKKEFLKWESEKQILRAAGEGDQARLTQLYQALTSIKGMELEEELTTTTQPTTWAAGEIPETTTMDPIVKWEMEEKARKESEAKEMEAVSEKNQMFEQLESNNNVDTLDDCTQLLSTIASIVGDGELVDLKGKDTAIGTISGTCMHKVLMNATLNDPIEAESMVSNNMQAISSLVTGTSDKVIEDKVLASDIKNVEKGDYGDYEQSNTIYDEEDTSDITAEQTERDKASQYALQVQRKKAITQVDKMLESVELMQKKLVSIVFPGEPPITVNTEDGLVMTLVMMDAKDLLGYELWQGGGLYVFPDICTILQEERVAPRNCSSTQSGNFTVGIQAIAWPTILQSFGEGAKSKLDRSTKTMQLRLVERISPTEVKVIPVQDLDKENEIIIYVPRGSRKKERTRLYDPLFVSPNEYMDETIGDPLVCSTLSITQPYSAINVEIILERREANVALFIRRGMRATLAIYDKLININNITRAKNVSQPALDVFDPSDNTTTSLEYPMFDVFLDDDFVGNETGFYYVCLGEFANNTDDEIKTFWTNPKSYNLTSANMTNEWTTNYTVRMYTSSCLFYNSKTLSWDNEGCRVLNANATQTVCSCNHLTSFGSGFFPQPNLIDFNKILNMNAADNPTIIITMIVSLCVYIMLIIWGRFKDKEDLTKLGATPLPDNDPRDKYLYEIMVFTGGKEEAATKSKVQFTISGNRLDSDIRTLADPTRRILARNAVDIFVMAVPESLGNLQYLRIWHDNSGKGPDASWYLRYIIFRDVQTGQKYEFISNQWFAVEHEDSRIDRLIAVAGDAQKKEFKHLFDTTSHKNLYDGHLWFSVFARPARSRFTRVQRITACMALLYLSMVANAMFYGVIPEEPGAGALNFGPFSLSSAAIGVGIVSNIITFPPTLLIIQLFRKATPKYKRVSRIQKAMEKQKAEKKKEVERKRLLRQKNASLETGQTNADNTRPESSTARTNLSPAPVIERKKPKSFPWWTLYIAWFVAIIAIGAGGCFTFFYGVQFGEEKTKKWLSALLVSFFSSVLLTQPVKVFLMAIIFSAVCKKPVDDDEDADFDERDPVLGEDEEWMHELGPGTGEKKKIEYKPVDEKKIRAAKIERKKEIQMWDIIYDLGAYAFFIWIVLILSHGNRDPNSFLMRKEIENNFISASLSPNSTSATLYSVQNKTLFFHWLKTVFVDEIVMQENYNNIFNAKHDNKKLLNDRVSLLLGYATLRQVRIKKKTCRAPRIVRDYITKECRDKSSITDEEEEDFDVGWRPLTGGTRPREEYTYRGSLELDGMPLWGNIDVYSGAGYQVKLKGSKAVLIAKFEELEANNWIDERTRAIFVEFSVFNAQVNLFASCRICLEQGPEGGLHPYVRINPIKLFRYGEGFALFVMICEGLFIAFIIYYTYREFKDMCRDKRKYWDDPWNYLELIVVILGWSSIVFYGIRTGLGVYMVNKFKKSGTGYIKLDYAASVDEAFLYIISFLVFFSTLKFMKLLRFNKRMGMLSSTLKQCASDLSGFMLAFLMSFLSFAQLFYLLLYSSHQDYTTFVMSVEASFAAMLGKFDYMGIAQSSPGIGPAFFFIFTFFTGIIMINLLLTLVLRSFYEIKRDIAKQSNDYEIVDFMFNKFKAAVGLSAKTNQVGALKSTTEDLDEEDDKADEFPEKVDQLLDYINNFYFDSKLDFSNKEWLKQMSKQNRDREASSISKRGDNWRGRSAAQDSSFVPQMNTNDLDTLYDL